MSYYRDMEFIMENTDEMQIPLKRITRGRYGDYWNTGVY